MAWQLGRAGTAAGGLLPAVDCSWPLSVMNVVAKGSMGNKADVLISPAFSSKTDTDCLLQIAVATAGTGTTAAYALR